MEAQTILAALFLFVFVAWAAYYVSRPLARGDWLRADEWRMRLAQLEWEKNIALQHVKDLDMDFRAKKVAEDDYRAQRAALLRDAAETIARLDVVRREALSAEIELEVARRRSKNVEP